MRTLLLFVSIFFVFDIYSQNFVEVTKSNDGKTINLARSGS